MQLPWNRQQTELEREVAYHIETMADALQAQGMSPADALREARRQFGGVEQVKEACRAESRWAWVAQVRQDLRFSWRMMKKSPAISVAAIVSLALGIGATTAIWSMADAISVAADGGSTTRTDDAGAVGVAGTPRWQAGELDFRRSVS